VTLVPTAELVRRAQVAGAGVPAFNIVTLEHVEAVAEAAERSGADLILQISENAVRFHHGQLHPLASAAAAVSRASSADLSLHLDHVTDLALLEQAAGAGMSSVMFDAGALPYSENVAATSKASALARAAGLWFEAELGYVGGKCGSPSSAHEPGVRTDPAEAEEFVAACRPDGLAVAVGSTHAMTERTARLDLTLVQELAGLLDVPLVLHGSSGVSPADLRAAARAGMRKINVGTALNLAYTSAVRQDLANDPAATDPRRYLRSARERMAAAVIDFVSVVSA
jgi:fructose-bisphosphate aldolase class II